MQSLIRNSKQVKQAIDFTGIGDKKFHPTDIDAVLEFNNKSLILFEVKKIGHHLPTGQRLLLERLVDSWHTDEAIALVVKHNIQTDEGDIPLRICWVRKYYYKGKWYQTNKPLKQQLQKIVDKWKIKKLKL